MAAINYERYGLTGNPFRELASEDIDDVAAFHVDQDVDEALRTIREEVFEKENRAVIAIEGPHGAGKTQRLKVTASVGQERKAFVVYLNLPASDIVSTLAKAFRAAATAAGVVKLFGSPAWYRELAPLSKPTPKASDPVAVGRLLAKALNDRAPSFLLLNDLQNLVQGPEEDEFAAILQELVDLARPGVLVAFTALPDSLHPFLGRHVALAARINRIFDLSGMSDDQAGMLLAKKMLAKRVVEELDPIYPFDREAVSSMNRLAGGNPRRLIELGDHALDAAASRRAYRIDSESVGQLGDSTVSVPKSLASPSASP